MLVRRKVGGDILLMKILVFNLVYSEFLRRLEPSKKLSAETIRQELGVSQSIYPLIV